MAYIKNEVLYNDSLRRLTDNVNEMMEPLETLDDSVGAKGDLATINKDSLVGAINELLSNIGKITSLSTTAKTNLVLAINEVVANLGNKASLTTTIKTSIVLAINEIVANVGSKTELTTTDKTSLVKAINEVVFNLENTAQDIGVLGDLKTEVKVVVPAINELVDDLGNIIQEIGVVTDLKTTTQSIVPAINEIVDTVGDMPQSSVGRPIRILFGVIRNTSGTWEFVTDSVHEKLNFGNLQVVGQDLQIGYSFNGLKVGTLVVTPDETMASSGVSVGASVGVNVAYLKFYAPLSCVVNGSGSILYKNNYLGSILTTEMLPDGSGFKLKHPTIFDGLGDVPNISPMIESAATRTSNTRFSYGDSFVQVQHYSNLAGHIEYNGTTWNYTSDNINKPTITFSGGDLTLNFNIDHTQVDSFGINLTPRSKYIPIVKSASASIVVINFIDSTTGLVVTAPTTDLRLFFTRNIQVLSKMPTSLRVGIRRGMVQVPAVEMLTGGSGNFWIYGAMNI